MAHSTDETLAVRNRCDIVEYSGKWPGSWSQWVGPSYSRVDNTPLIFATDATPYALSNEKIQFSIEINFLHRTHSDLPSWVAPIVEFGNFRA